jgi:hypothetical protein
VTEASWGPDGLWRLWIGEGVIQGLIELLDEHLAAPEAIHGPSPADGVLGGGDASPGVAALGVVPWLTNPDVTRRLQRMRCCVVVDKEAKVTGALRELHENGTPFPAESIPGFDEDLAPVDEGGMPMVVDPGTPWPPRPESIGPVRVWGFITGGTPKPLAHTKLLLLGKVAWFKNYAWPEGGPGEYQRFVPELAWFGSANWTRPAESQHLEMGAFTRDDGFVHACLDYVSHVVLESEPLGSVAPIKTPEMQPVKFDDEAFADYLAEFGWPDGEEW